MGVYMLTVYQILRRKTFLSLKVFITIKRNSNTEFNSLIRLNLCQEVVIN